MDKNSYKWRFRSVGGAVRVDIQSGEDIAHLDELDRKMWTVLSCPVSGLEFDSKTLALLDADKDGKIRVDEVIAAAKWLTGIIKNPDLILKGSDTLPLSEFNTENPDGDRLLGSAKQILENLGLEKDSISLDDTSDNVKIFEKTLFNGDGLITEATAGEDEALKDLITKIATAVGSAADRSGAPGISAEGIEAFWTACTAFKAWKDAAEEGKEAIFPYGDDTEAAHAAVETVKAKVEDFFMRCKLIAFNEGAAPAVDVSLDKIGEISASDIAADSESLSGCPLARPTKDALLPVAEGINPAWHARFAAVKALVLDKLFPDEKAITEAQWKEVLDSFSAYTAWKDSKQGAEVEALGYDDVKAILDADRKADLLSLVEKDKEFEQQALSIEEVDKLLRLFKNFYCFLNNYVVLSDFYKPESKAIFQAGRLYIDQRSTDLCIKVAGPNPDISSLSGMYILYCACKSEKIGKAFNIAAVLTAGDVDGLRVGKNAVFYDRDGNDYTATVTSIVENPISVRQAFWAPYKKVGRWISDKIDKNAAEKNSKSMDSLTVTADSATKVAPADGAAKPSSFDIAKFAGIFAAIGIALGYIMNGLTGLIKGAARMPFWKILIVIAAIILVISLPSMFIAWRKLRRRDLGPVLNANGWAINAASLVSIKFGKTLTSVVKYPKMSAVDPKERRKARIRRCLWSLLALIVLAGGFLFFTDRLTCIGLPFHKPQPVEEITETPEAEAEGEAPEASLEDSEGEAPVAE